MNKIFIQCHWHLLYVRSLCGRERGRLLRADKKLSMVYSHDKALCMCVCVWVMGGGGNRIMS